MVKAWRRNDMLQNHAAKNRFIQGRLLGWTHMDQLQYSMESCTKDLSVWCRKVGNYKMCGRLIKCALHAAVHPGSKRLAIREGEPNKL